MLVHICSHLDQRALARLGQTCRRLHDLVNDQALWTRVDVSGSRRLCDRWLREIGTRRPRHLSIAKCRDAKTSVTDAGATVAVVMMMIMIS
jgi:hypothetical protein